MAPYPKIASCPPLCQLTTIAAHQQSVNFAVAVEWSHYRPAYLFELSLCYSNIDSRLHHSQWNTIALAKSIEPALVLQPGEEDPPPQRLFFVGILTREELSGNGKGRPVFTIKYRVNEYAPWHWTNIQNGEMPGELLLEEKQTEGPIESIIHFHTGWTVTKLKGQSGSSDVASIESSENLDKATESTSRLQKKTLGVIPDLVRYFALVRYEPYWIGPRHGREFFYIGEEGLLVSFLTSSGQILTLMAFNGNKDVYTVFDSGPNGEIVVSARSDVDDTKFKVLAAVGDDVYTSIATVLSAARDIVNRSPTIASFPSRKEDHDVIAATSPEAWYDGLMYCTWNGLGQNLTSDKILSCLELLRENGIHPATLLIDDNWQTLGETRHSYSNYFNRGFKDMAANDGFPGGLDELVKQVKQSNPHIRDIGVWHALFGYWAGIAPGGGIAKDYRLAEIDIRLKGNRPSQIHAVCGTDVARFYDDFYSWLSSQGVTFVKTDVQHMLAELAHPTARCNMVESYQAAWITAYTRHFAGKAISCMSQIPQTLFRGLLQTRTPCVLLRNSDDFYPEIPKSHPWHIWSNAHNAVLTRELNCVPDWDMFQTSHRYSRYHAAARCISGGPVIVTDVPGTHDLGLVNEMTATSTHGVTIALRPSAACSMGLWNEYTDGGVLKVGSVTKNEGMTTGFLGVFNVYDRAIDFFVSSADFPSVETTGERFTTERVLLTSHETRKIFGPIDNSHACDIGNLVFTSFEVGGFDILVASPLFSVPDVGLEQRTIDFAVLGLDGKMTGAAAITSLEIEVQNDDVEGKNYRAVMMKIELKALGSLKFWVKGIRMNVSASLQGNRIDDNRVTLVESGDRTTLLHVDLYGEWDALRLWDKKQNEAKVEVKLW